MLDECYLSHVTIVYCDNGVPRKTMRWLNGTCWEAVGVNNNTLEGCIQASAQCLDPGYVRWLKLKTQNDCVGLPNQCTYAYVQPPDWVTCPASALIMNCDCFEELDPTDCSAIEILCCDEDGDCFRECPTGCN